MIIRHITIQDFGSVQFYDTPLTRSLNIVDSRYTPEIATATEFLLCSKALETIPPTWLRPTTRLTAEVIAESYAYTVSAVPCDGRLMLTVKDDSGTEVTDAYQNMLSHCLEQDATDRFDGQDKTLPLRLCWYRNCADAPENISGRTDSLTDTKTFRSHLIRYIKAFQPEPVNCKKAYQTAIDPLGRFEVFYPGVSGSVSLSETEEKLFLYICFLNISEFWADIEQIRDLHHEKKPLLIQNFLEFLDESTDISALVARTVKLQRQMIILTQPLSEDVKRKWIGKEDNHGIFFESGCGV